MFNIVVFIFLVDMLISGCHWLFIKDVTDELPLWLVLLVVDLGIIIGCFINWIR